MAAVSYNTDAVEHDYVTRHAARSGFERFVEDAITYTATEFSVSRALRKDRQGAGGKVVDRLLKNSDTLWERVVQPELDAYRRQVLAQFDVLLECIEDGDDIEHHRSELLATDAYNEILRGDIEPDRRAEIQDALLERQQQFGAAVEPLVSAPVTEFWPAVEAVFDRPEAEQLVEEHFTFTSPLRDHPGAFRMETHVDPGDILGGVSAFLPSLPEIEVEYTDEALRSMERAEKRVIGETKRELDRRYGPVSS